MRTPAPIARVCVGLALAMGLALFTGCRSAGSAQDEQVTLAMTFSPDIYPEVHAATVEVLREHGFAIERNDYRFGTVTTEPKESPTLVEFWIDDATTSRQARSDTLNAQQRTVSVRVERVRPEFDLTENMQQVETDNADDAPVAFRMTVEVLVERRQRPDRYLTHSATSRLSASYTNTPGHLSDRGIDGPYAQVLTRDPHLERRIVEAIQQRCTQMQSEPTGAADATDTPDTPEPSEVPQQLREQAQALFAAASHEPARPLDHEAAMIDRYQRQRHFNQLSDLLEHLIRDYPDDPFVSDLNRRAMQARARFESAWPDPNAQ